MTSDLPHDVSDQNILKAGKEVLLQERSGLDALQKDLGDGFVRAVKVLSKVKGHVALTGMGKSGIVARKIASTMASTGTPSFFIHPAEASHGDLGLITKDDALIALSNSGKTKELHDLLEYARRLNIPLIAITRRSNTIMSDIAHVELVVPEIPEACPNGLAPTTSTTMMMALGDAIAVCLLKLRDFSASDFRQLHPGGNLGRNLLRVQEFMHTGNTLPLVKKTDPMIKILSEITTKRMGCAGVVDEDGHLIGIITDGDLRRNMLDIDLAKAVAVDIMTPNPKTIRPQALVAEAVAKMNENSITCFFILENEVPVGLLHIHDCLSAGFR